MTQCLPVPYEYEHKPIFSPQSQSKFLEHLSTNGNVRLACKAAAVSAQTAYRARRKSPHFAALWDAALLSARHHAEEVLAERALNGTEEAVYYHGEEVATRTRFSDRLLLAHLARLDRMAERAEVSAALAQLDDAIEVLGRGEELPHTAHAEPFDNAQDRPVEGRAEDQATLLRQAQDDRFSLHQDRVPCVPSCRDSAWEEAHEPLTMEERLHEMDAARPASAKLPHELARDNPYIEAGDIEGIQLAAFEDGAEAWWLILPTQEEWAEIAAAGT